MNTNEVSVINLDQLVSMSSFGQDVKSYTLNTVSLKLWTLS